MEAGFVYILDRMKDLIIRGGENIDCSEVEAAMNLTPAVRECSVFALPDARLGEVVGVAIWKTDHSVKVEEIIATAAKRLAKFKVGLSPVLPSSRPPFLPFSAALVSFRGDNRGRSRALPEAGPSAHRAYMRLLISFHRCSRATRRFRPHPRSRSR